MMTIPVTTIQTADGPANVPATPIPANATAIFCDGTNYTIYMPGDTLPAAPQD
ncbi:hypothetical protein [Burkholderia anthina]|uniref:hypothetical protein n=1 Tax=Burkholderia anthina TaxID=179879 RepID=UPI00158B6712|nr:hypothetical protein [Burkholderia anthina]